MGKSRGSKNVLISGIMFLLLFLEAGCSRPVGIPADEGTTQTAQTPFHDDAGLPAKSIVDSSASTYLASNRSRLPFHDAQSLPAGTLLMVRLKAPLLTDKPDSDQSFEASLDTPVIVGGNTLIPQGAIVSGRIESTRSSRTKPGRGYVELALQSIEVDGVDLPVQTASLFVRQPHSPDPSSTPIHLKKGHRLTFRLTQPLRAAFQSSQILP